jgi:enoyl-CoA hydratase
MTDFFRDEYQLNRYIFHYPKPYIALLDGITMGGGVGISIHGSHRIATDNLLFAMPETGIGFFPDVGGTYFLPRLSGNFGFYLGLTGTRIGCDECVHLGLATHKVANSDFPSIINELSRQDFLGNPNKAVTEIMNLFQVTIHPSALLLQQEEVDDCFSHHSMEEIVLALKNATQSISQQALNSLEKKSPTSLKVTLRALQQGKHLDFDACMNQEYRLVTRFLQGEDFIEGIRAVIIDKDQSPHWHPNRLEALTEEEIDKYFFSLENELV